MMRHLTLVVGATLVALSVLVSGAHADRKLRVVATIPDLKALTEAVGGELVDVDSLSRGTVNAHDITQNIVDGLARVVPEHRAVFEHNRQAFLSELERRMGEWTKLMEPVRGAKVVVYHPQWIYFLTRFGLLEAGWVEERPGIPPSPQHLVRLVRAMRDEGVKVLIYAPWNDEKLATRVADEAGAKTVLLAQMVGGVRGADSYIGAIDYNVKALAEALRR